MGKTKRKKSVFKLSARQKNALRKTLKQVYKPAFLVFWGAFLLSSLIFNNNPFTNSPIFTPDPTKLIAKAENAVVEFEGVEGKPGKPAVSVILKSETNSNEQNSNDQNYELRTTNYELADAITTPIIHVDDSNLSYSRAKVTLEKSRSSKVNAVLYCSDENWTLTSDVKNSPTSDVSGCRNWEISKDKKISTNLLGTKVSFETTHFSAYAGAYLELLDFVTNLTVNDTWENRFRTYGTSNLEISMVEGDHFVSDLEFLGIYCNNKKIDDGRIAWSNAGDTLTIENYNCDEGISFIKNKALTLGEHWLSFSFGETQNARAHNFACSSGDLSTTCTVSASKNLDGELDAVAGSGSLVIASGGVLTASGTSAITVTMTGDVTIQSGGSITANATITAANVDVQSGWSINVNGKGSAGGGTKTTGSGTG